MGVKGKGGKSSLTGTVLEFVAVDNLWHCAFKLLSAARWSAKQGDGVSSSPGLAGAEGEPAGLARVLRGGGRAGAHTRRRILDSGDRAPREREGLEVPGFGIRERVWATCACLTVMVGPHANAFFSTTSSALTMKLHTLKLQTSHFETSEYETSNFTL